MKWFKSKEQPKVIEEDRIAHEHIWKDFPWYMVTTYSGTERTASYEIIEPYVCVLCGERINKILETEAWTNINAETRETKYSNIRKKYKRYLRSKAIVEDMIQDVLMVKDPAHLEMVEKMRGLPHSGVGSSSQRPQEMFKIDLERR